MRHLYAAAVILTLAVAAFASPALSSPAETPSKEELIRCFHEALDAVNSKERLLNDAEMRTVKQEVDQEINASTLPLTSAKDFKEIVAKFDKAVQEKLPHVNIKNLNKLLKKAAIGSKSCLKAPTKG
jgi:hypothetical protein